MQIEKWILQNLFWKQMNKYAILQNSCNDKGFSVK